MNTVEMRRGEERLFTLGRRHTLNVLDSRPRYCAASGARGEYRDNTLFSNKIEERVVQQFTNPAPYHDSERLSVPGFVAELRYPRTDADADEMLERSLRETCGWRGPSTELLQSRRV